jgi:hypothetical protein
MLHIIMHPDYSFMVTSSSLYDFLLAKFFLAAPPLGGLAARDCSLGAEATDPFITKECLDFLNFFVSLLLLSLFCTCAKLPVV